MRLKWIYRRLLHLAVGLCLTGYASAYELQIQDGERRFSYTQADLLAMHDAPLQTTTPWTDGVLHLEGALLKTVLADAGIDAERMLAKALNDYSVMISIPEAIEEGAFIAVQMDGEPMRVRDKGPFWIVFPWSDKPELLEREIRSWSIWQLQRLDRVE